MARKRRTFGLFTAAAEAQAATWAVLGIRVPQLMSGRMSAAERTRMVAEKVDALAESQRATAMALGRMALHPARTPAAMASAAAQLAGAAFDPFHKRVTANAKRLGKSRKRRSF